MARNWVKYHIVNFCANADLSDSIFEDNYSYDRMVERQKSIWKWEKDKEVDDMIIHLLGTGQIVRKSNGIMSVGKVIFEDADPVSQQAANAAQAVYDNLCDRRGIKQEMCKLSDDVKEEFLNEIAIILDQHFETQPAQGA